MPVCRRLWFGLVATLVPCSPAVSAPLQPTGKWVVDFANARCVASRNYGTAKGPIVLGLKAPPIGDVIQIILVDPGRQIRVTQRDATLKFGAEEFRSTALVHPSAEEKHVVSTINVPLEVFRRIQASASLNVEVKGAVSAVFELNQMDALMKVVDSCVLDLRNVWNVYDSSSGVRPTRGDNLSKSAQGDLAGLLKPSDYPQVSINEFDSGEVLMVLLIDEKGKIADCSVIATSGAAALDHQSCAILRERAKFEPAADRNGRAAKHAITQRFRWLLQR